MTANTNSWFPLFEFQDWIYQSFLVLPTNEDNDAIPGSLVSAKKWAKGSLVCGQAFKSEEGYSLTGRLSFRPGVELSVSAKGALGVGDDPAPFEAIGEGTDGPTKGSVYELSGWVFPEEPIQAGAAKVLSIKGSVRAVRGPDTKPETELGGTPAKVTVGTFVIARAK
jgi:hypothetical protein